MIIVEARMFSESMTRPGSNRLSFQLTTGKMPFPERTDPNVTILVFQGKRPSKPRRFEAPGITPEIWKIAEKCWHQKAKERPEVKTVLQDLENIVNAGGCTHSASVCHGSSLVHSWSRSPPRIFTVQEAMAWGAS